MKGNLGSAILIQYPLERWRRELGHWRMYPCSWSNREIIRYRHQRQELYHQWCRKCLLRCYSAPWFSLNTNQSNIQLISPSVYLNNYFLLFSNQQKSCSVLWTNTYLYLWKLLGMSQQIKTVKLEKQSLKIQINSIFLWKVHCLFIVNLHPLPRMKLSIIYRFHWVLVNFFEFSLLTLAIV